MAKNQLGNVYQTIVTIAAIMKIRWFFIRDARWFFLAIITIALLLNITMSFFLSLNSQPFFITDSDDVLIISQNQGFPTLSEVPSYWVDDILRLQGYGVLAVSAETVDIVFEERIEKPVFLRGVSESFKAVEKGFSLLSGTWFKPSS
ncbi:MAG TPA: hypothetical protein VJ044_14385, partial [Candidatus Hodarchaeales archaeon]|nr:hypothetical protein [Candidatus Hodarchaeales archaeon]